MKKNIIFIAIAAVAAVAIAAICLLVIVKDDKKEESKEILIEGIDISKHINPENPFEMFTEGGDRYILITYKNEKLKLLQVRDIKVVFKNENEIITSLTAVSNNEFLEPGEEGYFLGKIPSTATLTGEETIDYHATEHLLDKKEDAVKAYMVNGIDISELMDTRAYLTLTNDGVVMVKLLNERDYDISISSCTIEFRDETEEVIYETIEAKADRSVVKPGEYVYFAAKLNNYKDNYDPTHAVLTVNK